MPLPRAGIGSVIARDVFLLAPVITFDYYLGMKASEMKRKLERLGCVVTEGSKHWIVTYQGRRTTIPRHGGREIKSGTYHSILRALKVKLN